MKHIVKGQEPEIFAEWKTQNIGLPTTWESLPSNVKEALRLSLILEQGRICCYCGIRIEDNRSHVEHLKPRSSFPGLIFDYLNLMASCQGGLDDSPRGQIHCGHKKGDWYDAAKTVSPLNSECEGYFVYRSDGAIEPSENPDRRAAATETIAGLGLDISKLNAMRRKALEPIVERMDSLSGDEARNLIDHFCRRDSKGRFAPFCTALVYVLRQYFHVDDPDTLE